MSEQQEKEFKSVKVSKVIYPIIFGLGVVAFFLWREFDADALTNLHFNSYFLFWLFCAVLCMIFRDLGYMIRLKVLSDNKLNWRQCFRVIMLWEFTSAVTPSAIGGTGVAIIYVNKEGLNLGKSASIIIATSFLDELYFTLIFPIFFIFFSLSELFHVENSSFLSNQLIYFAIIGYSIKTLWTVLMWYSIFINPAFFGKLVKKVFKIRFLKRWLPAAEKMAVDFEYSNVELKNKSFKFWAKSFLSTFLSWTSRYWVLNFLLLCLIASLGTNTTEQSISVYEHFLIFVRQLIMWIMMLVMPTPGGSGLIEMVFTTYMADFVPVAGLAIIMALLWRLITYYPYLIIGAIIFPRWLKDKFKKK